MRYSKVDNNLLIVRLEKGEKVIESIKNLCEKLKIKNGCFIGIGSVEDPIVAHYMVGTRKYSEKKLSGIFEVTSLTGNVALFESKPLIHGHITLSDDDMHAFGGHLVEAKVSATLEITFSKLNSSKIKTYNKGIGLKLLELDEEL